MVPIFPPIITPIACLSVMTLALTIPTTITVVTELDWIIPVIAAPTPQATMRLSVTLLINFLSFSPAIACIPSDMYFIPRRNNPKPPTTWTIIFRISSMSNITPNNLFEIIQITSIFNKWVVSN